MTDFRHHGDRLVHQGYIWRVVVGEFEAPDGERFTRDIVRSPGAVAAVPVRSDANGTPHVVLVRQYRAPFDSAVVEVPAGMRDIPDEPTELTAERELVEEVGLRPGRLEHLVDFFPSVGMTDAVLAVYLATDLEDVGRETHGPEEAHMDVIEVPLTEAVAMIERGEIHDAKTIIGLLLAERRLRERGAL
ncbi:MAG: putative ADP-ribose pyrophosphatase [Actinomycetota bacterium]|jgi:ADP-ribose pyrophosphatase